MTRIWNFGWYLYSDSPAFWVTVSLVTGLIIFVTIWMIAHWDDEYTIGGDDDGGGLDGNPLDGPVKALKSQDSSDDDVDIDL